MRLTYRRTIELHLGRQETKLWKSSDAYRDELQRHMRDMATDRQMSVELYLSSFGTEDGQQLLADAVVPHNLIDRDPLEIVS